MKTKRGLDKMIILMIEAAFGLIVLYLILKILKNVKETNEKIDDLIAETKKPRKKKESRK